MSMCGYVHLSAGAWRGQDRVLDSLELNLIVEPPNVGVRKQNGVN